jgi:hypothetical protein
MDLVKSEVHDAYLATTGVLLSNTKRRLFLTRYWSGLVAVGEQVDLSATYGTAALAVVGAVHQKVRGAASWQLRSEVLNDSSVQAFLRSNDAFQELVCGIYCSNKACSLVEVAGSEGPSEKI